MKTNCRYCGIGFTYPPEFGKVKYCSSRCRVTHRPPRELWEYKGCHGSDYYGKKRRRQMSSGDKIDYLVVYEHYNWECHLCENQIDRALTFPDPECATIDHIVRLADGGTHTWMNIAPAHLACQEKKEKLVKAY